MSLKFMNFHFFLINLKLVLYNFLFKLVLKRFFHQILLLKKSHNPARVRLNISFYNRYGDIVQRQKMLWDAKYQGLAKQLKIPKEHEKKFKDKGTVLPVENRI